MNLGDSGQRVPKWQAGEGGVVAHDAMRRQLEVVGLGDCSEVLNTSWRSVFSCVWCSAPVP